MLLNQETKDKITTEYESFKENLYAGKTLEQRRELDQFFTPPSITIKMIETFNCDSLEGKSILDPCCGSGNLLAACLIAGADADKIFGNDYDKAMVELSIKRLTNLSARLNKQGFQPFQIHRGNALQKLCLQDFSENYLQHYNEKYIDDITYAQDSYVKRRMKSLW